MKDTSGAESQKWIDDLSTFLAQMEVAYTTRDNIADRRYAACIAVMGIFERLERLEELKGLGQLQFARGIADFFGDVHRGRNHPWLSLGPFGGNQNLTRAQQRTQAGALIAIEMLIDALGKRHGDNTKAYKIVSNNLKKAGISMEVVSLRGLHRRYKKESLACKTEVDLFMSTFWTPPLTEDTRELRCPHGHPVHHCPTGADGRCADIAAVAEFYIENVFADEMFLQTA